MYSLGSVFEPEARYDTVPMDPFSNLRLMLTLSSRCLRLLHDGRVHLDRQRAVQEDEVVHEVARLADDPPAPDVRDLHPLVAGHPPAFTR